MSRQNSDTETSFSSDSEGRESDNNLSNLSEIRGDSSGNEADDEAENPITYENSKNELPEFVQQGTIHGIEEDSPQEELGPKTTEEEKEENIYVAANCGHMQVCIVLFVFFCHVGTILSHEEFHSVVSAILYC